MAVKVRIEGLRELDRALSELPKATARNVLVRTLRGASEPLVAAAKEKVPVRTGNLKDSIAFSTKKPKGHDAGARAFAEAMSEGASRAEAGSALRAARAANPNAFAEGFVGPGRHPQAIFQEFGTSHHPPQPFMRPAWDATKHQVLNIIKSTLGENIHKAAQRLARKAARQAAKGG